MMCWRLHQAVRCEERDRKERESGGGRGSADTMDPAAPCPIPLAGWHELTFLKAFARGDWSGRYHG